MEYLSANIKHPKSRLYRDQWTNQLDSFFALLGVTVGLGNIWRFPFLCYNNGGGTFLIPYTVCVFIVGLPLYFLEMTLGQYTSQGGLRTWDAVCPLMKGIFGAIFVMTIYSPSYYNVIMAWSFYYLFSSFTTVLPWAHCNNTWNTEFCNTQPLTGSFNKTPNHTYGKFKLFIRYVNCKC